MMTKTRLEKIKEVMLRQLNEDDTRLFYDEWFLRDVMEKEQDYKELLIQIEQPLELNPLQPGRFTFRVLVTPSTRPNVNWQVTIFKGDEPQGHREYETFKEAIEDNSEEWFNQGLWCWKDNDIEKGLAV